MEWPVTGFSLLMHGSGGTALANGAILAYGARAPVAGEGLSAQRVDDYQCAPARRRTVEHAALGVIPPRGR